MFVPPKLIIDIQPWETFLRGKITSHTRLSTTQTISKNPSTRKLQT
jgi:hypothetical protein